MIIETIKKEFELRLIEEGFTRITKCLSFLDQTELWTKPNANSNSMGHIVLHLEGNVRQYILSGIRGDADTRNRPLEFNDKDNKSKEEILMKLKQTLVESNTYVQSLTEDALTAQKSAQGFSLTTLSIIIHVIEHFSYHVGQITYYVKLLKNVDTGYYAGQDLNIKSN